MRHASKNAHVLLCSFPKPDLRQYVRVYAQRKLDTSGVPIVQRATPRLETVLEFQLDEPYQLTHLTGEQITAPTAVVIGASTRSLDMQFSGRIRSFGVFFRPTGFSALFGVMPDELMAHHYSAESVLGPQITELRDRLGEISSFEERVQLMEDFLSNQARTNPAIHATWSNAENIFGKHGVVRMIDAAREQSLSLRQFERLFRREIGISPKLYARVARLQSAIDFKIMRPGWSWTKIANDLGYYDQMHMVHDFQSLTSAAPGTVSALIGDGRPPAYIGMDPEHKLDPPIGARNTGAERRQGSIAIRV